MRVISGKLKGRKILGYDIVGTRPTMDRVKESIFSMIQQYLFDATVLDLFSGTGNYGIECISNGAKEVYFNDYNKKCVNIIQDNLTKMDVLNQSIITNYDYQKALNFYQDHHIKFDLVFLDPPYKEHIINNILDVLLKNELLNENSLVICECLNKDIYHNDRLVSFKEKRYGEKYVIIYKCGN